MYAWISFRVPEQDQTRQNLSENLGIGIYKGEVLITSDLTLFKAASYSF